MGGPFPDATETDRAVTLREIYRFVYRYHRTSEPVTVGEVSEEFNVSYTTAYNRLNELVDRGVIETKKVGAKARVYWLPSPVDH